MHHLADSKPDQPEESSAGAAVAAAAGATAATAVPAGDGESPASSSRWRPWWRRGRRFPAVEFTAGLVILVLLVACVVKGTGLKTWLVRLVVPSYKARPTVIATRPGNFESGVPLDAFVAVDIELPNSGRVVDASSLPPHRADTVRLIRTGDNTVVPAHVNTTGGGDAIVLQPATPLEPNTQYTFEITPGVVDTAGSPFRYFKTNFTTAAAGRAEQFPAAFEKVELPTADRVARAMFTCVTIGPDGRLYASAFDGRILRFDVNVADGTLGEPTTLGAVAARNGGPRLVTGIEFDPASTPAAPVLWVSHGQLTQERAQDWTGKISRLSGGDLSTYQDVIVNLPRGVKDHLNNQIAFGPDGALYFAQASNSAMGAPDHKWGYRPERLLSAAILRLDPAGVPPPGAPPIDARTEELAPGAAPYDPYAPEAPLTIYATGIRNGYDLLWHSNGSFYAPINGSAAGGNSPGSDDPRGAHARRPDTGWPWAGPPVPALTNILHTEDDTLLLVDRDAYYGHPNPLRGEFLLNGANPTAGADPAEVPAYPVGTRPDPNFRTDSFSFGKNLAPTGIIEYKTPGPLAGKILVTRYSGGDDVIVLSPDGPRGAITESFTGIDGLTGFSDPLDLIEDTRNGNLYVVEFGSLRLTLARPIKGGVSKRVFRLAVSHGQSAHAN